MTLKPVISTVLFFAFMASGTIAANAPASKPAPSNTVSASRTIQIYSSDQNHIDHALDIINRNRNLREAVQVVEQTAEVKPSQVTTDTVSLFISDPSRAEITIYIDLRAVMAAGAKPRAAEAADQIVGILNSVLNSHPIDMLRQNTGDLAVTKSALMLKRNQFSDDLSKVQQQLFEATGYGLPDSVGQFYQSEITQLENIKIDLAAKQARRDALAKQIGKLSDQIQEKIKNDPVAAELEKVMQFREQIVVHHQAAAKTGELPQIEVDEAVSNAAEARAKLLERRETAALAGGGDTLAQWNRELMNLAVDISELEARSAALNERVKPEKIAEVDMNLFKYEQDKSEIAALSKKLSDIDRQLEDAEFEMRSQFVSLRVVDSVDTPAPAK